MEQKTSLPRKISLLLIIMGFQGIISAQDSTQSTMIQLNYLFGSNDTVTLTADLAIRKTDGVFYLANAPLQFSVSDGISSTVIGDMVTDSAGRAKLLVPLSNQFPLTEDGLTLFRVTFAGKNRYEASEQEFAARPAWLTVNLAEEDSIRYIDARLMQKNAAGELVPVGEQTIHLYTPRLFSLLKIGEISLDGSGYGRIEFPANIIGDTLGNVMVYAQLEEHEQFGFVRAKVMAPWGIPKHFLDPEKPSRELWTPVAPLWMIITLIVMLAGVWAHYIYAIIQLVRIKRASEKA